MKHKIIYPCSLEKERKNVCLYRRYINVSFSVCEAISEVGALLCLRCMSHTRGHANNIFIRPFKPEVDDQITSDYSISHLEDR